MQVNSISQGYNSLTQPPKNISRKEEETISIRSESYKVLLSSEFKFSAVNITYTEEGNKLNKNEEKNSLQRTIGDSKENLAKTKEDIRKEIELQTVQLLKKYLEKFPEVKRSLKEFFENNSEALDQIKAGEIPEYFNVENTAKRILDIYFSKYNGEDKKTFAEHARSIISQAYSEVEQIVGTLPNIVIQTRDKVYEILDKFVKGEDVSEFIKIGKKQD